MATATAPADPMSGSAVRTLPPVTVGRVEEAARLIERLLAEKQSIFIEKGEEYRQQHRQATSRQLRPEEAGAIAAALGAHLDMGDPGATVASIQQSDIKAYDDPEPAEFLLAAGLSTAPALIDAVKQFVVLLELPDDEFEDACENDSLEVVLIDKAEEFRKVELADARERASAALSHYADAAGTQLGEALGSLVRMIERAYETALEKSPSFGSGSSSLINSLEPTDGTDEPSSTEPAGPTPSS